MSFNIFKLFCFIIITGQLRNAFRLRKKRIFYWGKLWYVYSILWLSFGKIEPLLISLAYNKHPSLFFVHRYLMIIWFKGSAAWKMTPLFYCILPYILFHRCRLNFYIILFFIVRFSNFASLWTHLHTCVGFFPYHISFVLRLNMAFFCFKLKVSQLGFSFPAARLYLAYLITWKEDKVKPTLF